MSGTHSADGYVEAPYLVPEQLEHREYQDDLVNTAREESSLVAMPTGTGKTAVAIRIAAHRLGVADDQLDGADGTILFVAPTKPLVTQHAEFARRVMTLDNETDIAAVTGNLDPRERTRKVERARFVVATPEVIDRDTIRGRYSLGDVVHLIVDECHHATGDHAYVDVATRYHRQATHPQVTGLSASPGTDRDEVVSVAETLGLVNIAVVTPDDPALDEFLPETTIETKTTGVLEGVQWAWVHLYQAMEEVLEDLAEAFPYRDADELHPEMPISEFQQIQQQIDAMIDDGRAQGYEASSFNAEAMKLKPALDGVGRRPPGAILSYLEDLTEEALADDGSQAATRLAERFDISQARQRLRTVVNNEKTSPKLVTLRDELASEIGMYPREGMDWETLRATMGDLAGTEGNRAVVFAESRNDVDAITEFLQGQTQYDAARFVGQAGTDGMSQDEQAARLEAFRNDELDVLVATSVAEEGLDFPAVDLVVFYTPIPSAIATVQRRGRTGRDRTGKVTILVAEETRDEQRHEIATTRIENMRTSLRRLADDQVSLRRRLRQQQRVLQMDGADGDHPQPTVVIDDESDLYGSSFASPLEDLSSVTPRVTDLPAGTVAVGEETGGEVLDAETVVAAFEEASDRAEVLLSDGGAQAEGEVDVDGLEDRDGRRQADAPGVAVPIEQTMHSDGASAPHNELFTDGVRLGLDPATGFTTTGSSDGREEDDGAGGPLDVTPDGYPVVVCRQLLAELAIEPCLGAYESPFLVVEGVTDMVALADRTDNPRLFERVFYRLRQLVDVILVDEHSKTLRVLRMLALGGHDNNRLPADRLVGLRDSETPREQKIKVLVDVLSNVGPSRAETLLEHFGSLHAVFAADAEDLTEIDGIGERTAEAVASFD